MIYNSLDKINDSLRCLEEVLRIARIQNDQYSVGIALNNIGRIYYIKEFQCMMIETGGHSLPLFLPSWRMRKIGVYKIIIDEI